MLRCLPYHAATWVKPTVDIYGSVFGQIAIAAIMSSLIMFALSPLLTKWMHEGEDDDEAQEQA